MAEVTIHSDFLAQEDKICHCFHFFPIYLSWSDRTGYHVVSFFFFFFLIWVLSQLFQSPLSLSSRGSLVPLHFLPSDWYYLHIKLVFLPAILIPACDLSSPAFCMMYSAYKWNKQGDNIQPCYIPYPILNLSIVPRLVLIVASWPAYRFLRRQVRWSGIPSLEEFSSLLWSTQSKAFA